MNIAELASTLRQEIHDKGNLSLSVRRQKLEQLKRLIT
jgi:hypothetical protein